MTEENEWENEPNVLSRNTMFLLAVVVALCVTAWTACASGA